MGNILIGVEQMPELEINKWLQIIPGFLQTFGEPNGMVGLWRNLKQYETKDVQVSINTWSENWESVAELIWRCRSDFVKPKVNIFAYSWGAGYGAIELAKYLEHRSLIVDTMILSDPVYRSRFFATRWLAFSRLPKIRIPDNVNEVYAFYQTYDNLRGHELVCGSDTIEHPPVIVSNIPHSEMDDLPQFQSLCRDIAI